MRSDQPHIFIVAGMPRTGTTFLYYTLQKHPQIFLPHRKESYYFSINYFQGHEWFNSLYKEMPNDCIGADIGPIYFHDPKSIERILQFSPDVKIILGIREPVSYLISLHNQMLSQGWISGTVLDMVAGYSWPLSDQASIDLVLQDGFIAEKVAEFGAKFKDNLMLYHYDVLTKNPNELMREIEKFIGVPEYFDHHNFENIKINASGRRNFKFLNFILRDQKKLSIVYSLLPNSVTRYLRNKFEKMSASGKIDDKTGREPEELARLSELFAGDTEYVKNLFRESKVLRL